MDEKMKKDFDEIIAKSIKEALGKEGFINEEQLKEALKNFKQPVGQPQNEFVDEKKFWTDLVTGKTAGDIDTASNAATIIPTVIANKIYEKMYPINHVRQIVTIFPGQKGTIPFEGTALSASRVADGTAPGSGTPGTAEYTAVSYDTYRLAADAQLSNKVVQEASPAVLDYIYSHLAKQFAATEMSEFITGDNSTQMQGLRTAAAAAAFTCVTAGTAKLYTDITYDDLVSVFMQLDEQYRVNASWIMSKTVLSHIRKMKDVNLMPIFNPSEKTIFGAKVYENSNVGTSGSTYPVLYFGDWKGYFLFDNGGLRIEATNEGRTLKAAGATYIIAEMDTDGKVVDPNGMTGLLLNA